MEHILLVLQGVELIFFFFSLPAILILAWLKSVQLYMTTWLIIQWNMLFNNYVNSQRQLFTTFIQSTYKI
jgi:hypothetical protein